MRQEISLSSSPQSLTATHGYSLNCSPIAAMIAYACNCLQFDYAPACYLHARTKRVK
jgi:hypothetical protein